VEYDGRGTTGGWKARRRRKQRRARILLGLMLGAVLGLAFFVRWIVVRRMVTSRPPLVKAGPGGPAYPDPPGIVLHASETPAAFKSRTVNAAWLEEVHARDHPDWATVFEGKTYHIGYHYVILPDGTIEQGRPDHCPGCHAPKRNDWIGICIVGQFDPSGPKKWWPSTPTKAQVASIVSLCGRLMSEYHIPPENVWRHSDVKKTWCPGRRFPYKEIIRQLRTYAAAHPDTQPVHASMITVAPSAVQNAGSRQ
jgi:N-acetyl-anhydromuramyl-L-alanine amidase AmpD